MEHWPLVERGKRIEKMEHVVGRVPVVGDAIRVWPPRALDGEEPTVVDSVPGANNCVPVARKQ